MALVVLLRKPPEHIIIACRRFRATVPVEEKENLDSAHNWGLFDMFAGGLISSLAKRSKMKQARQHMEQAKWDLRNFSEELKDVNMISHLDIETDDFLSFADWFFDGFFVDWMVQDRINTARDQVDEAIQRLKVILRELENS